MILIGLGANLPSKFGSPAETIRAALAALNESGLKVIAMSRLWLTAPVPVSDQPWYHNGVAEIETAFDASRILKTLQSIEQDFGRVREIRNEPRVIDLDLLACGNVVMNDPLMTVPHPRMQDRAFVLFPLQDIHPGWRHPVTGRTVPEMIAALPAGQEAKPIQTEFLFPLPMDEREKMGC
jgi:2-amino-4-hydroxy-6-hydroxymethyldihydropteridine diphosphokinase